jgi:hypothetical protein
MLSDWGSASDRAVEGSAADAETVPDADAVLIQQQKWRTPSTSYERKQEKIFENTMF